MSCSRSERRRIFFFFLEQPKCLSRFPLRPEAPTTINTRTEWNVWNGKPGYVDAVKAGEENNERYLMDQLVGVCERSRLIYMGNSMELHGSCLEGIIRRILARKRGM